jgi:hypothetical protein
MSVLKRKIHRRKKIKKSWDLGDEVCVNMHKLRNYTNYHYCSMDGVIEHKNTEKNTYDVALNNTTYVKDVPKDRLSQIRFSDSNWGVGDVVEVLFEQEITKRRKINDNSKKTKEYKSHESGWWKALVKNITEDEVTVEWLGDYEDYDSVEIVKIENIRSIQISENK